MESKQFRWKWRIMGGGEGGIRETQKNIGNRYGKTKVINVGGRIREGKKGKN